ncbi:MAG: ATP-binding protein [Lachnospiraceae bacterium]|nr:ATP-binding protein [Lachnospiraceae bacterium]
MSLGEQKQKAIIEHYDRLRIENRREERRRAEEVYQRIPGFKELDDSSASSSTQALRMMLEKSSQEAEKVKPLLKKKLQNLQQEKAALLKRNGFPENYLDPIFFCPDCQDTGYIDGSPCHCYKALETEFLLGQSNLRLLVETANFKNLSYSYYQDEDLKWFQKAVGSAKRFIQTFHEEYRNLFFLGTVGTGKTFLSGCIADELLKKGVSVYYFEASDFFNLLADLAFQKDGAPLETRESFWESQLLIIDDLGSELVNQFTTSRLFELLNARFLRRLPMIITTNLSLDDLQSQYSERILSRIISHFEILELSGKDIRMQKLKEAGRQT